MFLKPSLRPGSNNAFDLIKNTFCFREAKFASGKQRCFLVDLKILFCFHKHNLLPRRNTVFYVDSETDSLVSYKQSLLPQHTFLARLNWETFASTTEFPFFARTFLTAIL